MLIFCGVFFDNWVFDNAKVVIIAKRKYRQVQATETENLTGAYPMKIPCEKKHVLSCLDLQNVTYVS